MINAWNLAWIVPLAAVVGFAICAVFAGANKDKGECLGEPFDTEKAMNFIDQFAFCDSLYSYTNRAMLVPLSRVRDALVDKAGQAEVTQK